jgi:hypothetical protein
MLVGRRASGFVLVAKGLPNGRAPMYSAQWWAHLVGALRVHPHKHCANYPPQKDRENSGNPEFMFVFIEDS